MSTEMHIKSSETGVIRVFHIDLPREAIARFTGQAGTGEWPLQYALGATSLRAPFVEVIDIRDLGEMPLSTYLAQAHDIDDGELAEMGPRLDALSGHVLVLPAQAFNHTEQDLTISSPLRWIGTFNEPKADYRADPIVTDSAKGVGGGKAASPEPGGGSAFWVVVMVLALIVVAVIAARFVL